MTPLPTFNEAKGERKDVTSAVHWSPQALLGRHICCCPHNRAFAGERYIEGGGRSFLGQFRFLQLGQAEVEDLDVAIATHKDVLRFEIAMRDAGVMSAGESGSGLNTNVENISQRQSAAPQQRAQRLSLHQFH